MIYDCFIFNNELDILDIRLHELDSVVDKFVLVESSVTHVNRQKPLYYDLNKNRYKRFSKKIIHVVVKDTPNVDLAWIINDFQFSQMKKGLTKAKPDDVILFGDVDEIPKAEKVKEWKGKKGRHKLFIERLSYYYLNLSEYTLKPVNGTHMILYRDLSKFRSMWIAKYSKIDTEIKDGGWHFSYISNAKGIERKIETMAHQEFNNEKYNTPEKIRLAMLNGEDIFRRGLKFKVESISTLPEYVQKNQKLFERYILIKPYNSLLIAPIRYFLVCKDFARIFVRKLKKHQ